MMWTILPKLYKCDVICENLPSRGTNIVSPGQIPSVMRGVWHGPTTIFAHEYLHFCQSLNHKFYHKCVNIAELGLHFLFLHKAGFHRRRHKCVYVVSNTRASHMYSNVHYDNYTWLSLKSRTEMLRRFHWLITC